MGKKDKLSAILCSDPLNKNCKKKQTKRKDLDVQVIGERLLNSCSMHLPELNLNSNSYLCMSCRLALNRLLAERVSAGASEETGPRPSAPPLQDMEVDEPVAGSSAHPPVPTATHPPTATATHSAQCGTSTTMMAADPVAVASPAPQERGENLTSSELMIPEVALADFLSRRRMSTATVASSIEATSVAPTDIRVEDVNRSLGGLIDTPVRKGDRKQPRRLIKKYEEAKDTIKARLGHFSATFKGSPKRSCAYCDQLFNELALKFGDLKLKQEKYLCLTSVPRRFGESAILRKFGCTVYEARIGCDLRKKNGHFSKPTLKYTKQSIDEEIQAAVMDYFLHDDNSRPSPNVRDTILLKDPVTKVKVPTAKRYLLHSLHELYTQFKLSHPEKKIGRSKFAQLKPPQCRWPGAKGRHNICVCEVHENFKLMMEVFKVTYTSDEIAQKVLCNDEKRTYECYLGFCDDCPKLDPLENELFNELDEDEMVEFMAWTGTDKTSLNQISKTVADFRQDFLEYIPKLMAHHYINKTQKNFVTRVKEEQLETGQVVLIQVDFGQNYSFIAQNAVQGFHWNSTQCTLHPFVVYYYHRQQNQVKNKTYFVISDCLDHDARSFRAFQDKVIEELQKDLRAWGINPMRYVYLSDGAGGQYMNKNNFANLLMHLRDFGVPAEWHFTATSHGKSTCDAMVAVVKRSARLHSLKPNCHILTHTELYDFCVEKLVSESMCFVKVEKGFVKDLSITHDERYKLAKTVPGTRSFHSFVPASTSKLHLRLFSSSLEFVEFDMGQVDPPPVPHYAIESFVAVKVESKWQVGIVSLIDEELMDVEVSFMKRVGRGNKLKWPPQPVIDIVSSTNVLCTVEPPIIVQQDPLLFAMTQNDYDIVKARMRN